jgi:hypothetical protein
MRQETSAPSAALTLGVQLGGCAVLLVWTVWDICIDVSVLQLHVDTHRQVYRTLTPAMPSALALALSPSPSPSPLP